MIKKIIGLLSALMGVAAMSVLIACGETSVPQASELDRYPEFKPFLAGRTGFKGIRHDVDLGRYVFAFPTSLKTSEQYFDVVHEAATHEGWALVTSESLKRVYQRPSRAYPAARHDDRVMLIYIRDTAEVQFTMEPADLKK